MARSVKKKTQQPDSTTEEVMQEWKESADKVKDDLEKRKPKGWQKAKECFYKGQKAMASILVSYLEGRI